MCQTEGSKRWRLYPARPGFELPAVSSADFSQEEIGEPLLDVTLQARAPVPQQNAWRQHPCLLCQPLTAPGGLAPPRE